jgi:hypothetical protein
MNTQGKEALYLRLLIRGVAAILLGTSGIVAVMALGPTSTDMSGVIVALDNLRAQPARPVGAGAQIPPARAEGNAYLRVRCAECGVVESTREIGHLDEGTNPGEASGMTTGGRNETPGNSAKSYEVTVRMKDGSSRMFTHSKPGNWRPGERVILIEGVKQASN